MARDHGSQLEWSEDVVSPGCEATSNSAVELLPLYQWWNLNVVSIYLFNYIIFIWISYFRISHCNKVKIKNTVLFKIICNAWLHKKGSFVHLKQSKWNFCIVLILICTNFLYWVFCMFICVLYLLIVHLLRLKQIVLFDLRKLV